MGYHEDSPRRKTESSLQSHMYHSEAPQLAPVAHVPYTTEAAGSSTSHRVSLDHGQQNLHDNPVHHRPSLDSASFVTDLPDRRSARNEPRHSQSSDLGTVFIE